MELRRRRRTKYKVRGTNANGNIDPNYLFPCSYLVPHTSYLTLHNIRSGNFAIFHFHLYMILQGGGNR